MNQQNLISGISKTDRSDKSLIQHPKPVINRFPFIQYIYLGDSLRPGNSVQTRCATLSNIEFPTSAEQYSPKALKPCSQSYSLKRETKYTSFFKDLR